MINIQILYQPKKSYYFHNLKCLDYNFVDIDLIKVNLFNLHHPNHHPIHHFNHHLNHHINPNFHFNSCIITLNHLLDILIPLMINLMNPYVITIFYKQIKI